MNDRTVVYSTYYNPIEANIIRSRLEDGGFSCFLADENVATINPFYNQAIGGVKLIVFERDVEKITELLAEEINNESFPADLVGELEKTENKIVCTECSSVNVGYGMATKRKHNWWFSIFLLLFTFPIKVNKCYHCYDCGYEFE